MTDFQALQTHELQRLPPEEVADYVARAFAAGDMRAARAGSNLLAYTWEPRVRTWVAAKVTPQDVDDVVEEVLLALTRACYEGKAIGKFGGFLKGVTHNKIVDHYRGEERRGTHAQVETGREEADEAVFVPSTADESGTVPILEAVERVLDAQTPLHQKVLRLYGAGIPGFEDLRGKDVAARINSDDSDDTMTEANVNQIFHRFKAALEAELNG
jgi:DNA-directed RNA polymerase specialized sigma24 family protein